MRFYVLHCMAIPLVFCILAGGALLEDPQGRRDLASGRAPKPARSPRSCWRVLPEHSAGRGDQTGRVPRRAVSLAGLRPGKTYSGKRDLAADEVARFGRTWCSASSWPR